MIKGEFVDLYSKVNGIENVKEALKNVNEFLDTMKEIFKKDSEILLWKFGKFQVKETATRKIVDPRGNGNIIESKPRKYIKFTASKSLEKILYDKNK